MACRPQLAARVADDPGERVDESDTAADRDRHAAELDRARDHLRHEPRDGALGAEPRVQHPRRQEAAGLVRCERPGRPVPAGRERVAGELQGPATAEPAEHPLRQSKTGTRPQLGSEHAEAEVGVRHELVELPLPRRAVTCRPAVELSDVRFERRVQEHRRAVGERGRRGEVGVHVLEAPRVELVTQLGVRSRAGEQRMPRAQHLVREAGKRVVHLGANRTAETVALLEHADAPALPREQCACRQGVDPRPDEDGIEPDHAARLRTVIPGLTCHRRACDRIGAMLLREVAYARPATVEEAVGLLSEHDGARALAGGQTLVNVMKQRAASPDVLVDLASLDELKTIAVSGTTLEIGAMATLSSIIALVRGRGQPPDPRRGRSDRRRRAGAKPRARSAGTSASTTRRTTSRRCSLRSARR